MTEIVEKSEEKSQEKIIDICLDATMLDTFVSCPAKFNMRFNMNKTSKEKAPPLDRGDLAHKGLEPYYKELQKGTDFNNALEAAVNGFNLASIDSDLEPSEVTTVRKAMIENLTYWKNEDTSLEILAVEESFAYELFVDDKIRITMMGKIDLLYNDRKLGIIPLDHKTYQVTRPLHRKTNQFCNYTYATGRDYLMVNRIGLQTSLPLEKKHKRIPLSYDSLFLEQWKQNTIKWCYLYALSAADNSWPMNDTSCDKYNRLCEYYPICDSSGIEAKLYKLNVDFKTSERWDVAKSLGLGK